MAYPLKDILYQTFLYIYIRYMISKHILMVIFLSKPEIIFFAHKRFHLFLSKQITLFTINNLFVQI